LSLLGTYDENVTTINLNRDDLVITSTPLSTPFLTNTQIKFKNIRAHGPGGSDAGGGDRHTLSKEKLRRAFINALSEFNGHYSDNIVQGLFCYLDKLGLKKEAALVKRGLFPFYHQEIKQIKNKRKRDKIFYHRLRETDEKNISEEEKRKMTKLIFDEKYDRAETRITKNRYFIRKKFILLYDKACTDRDHNAKDASVKGNDLDSKICLSLYNLSKSLPEVIKKEIIALIFHEASHLTSLNEEEASQVQGLYLKYADDIYQERDDKVFSRGSRKSEIIDSMLIIEKAINDMSKMVEIEQAKLNGDLLRSLFELTTGLTKLEERLTYIRSKELFSNISVMFDHNVIDLSEDIFNFIKIVTHTLASVKDEIGQLDFEAPNLAPFIEILKKNHPRMKEIVEKANWEYRPKKRKNY
jgi:hypothetical protein